MLKAVQLDPTAHSGAMIALMLTPEQQGEIAALVPWSAGADHCTLIYLADDAGALLDRKAAIIEALAGYCATLEPLSVPLNGYGRFMGDAESYPVVLLLDNLCLASVRDCLLACCSVTPDSTHGFTPHITLTYLPAGEALPYLDVPPTSLTFASISLIWGGERIDIPLMVTEPALEEAVTAYEVASLDTESAAALIPEQDEAKADDEEESADEDDIPPSAGFASDTVKSLPIAFAEDSTKWIDAPDSFIIRIPGVRWSGKDLVGDTFTKDTDIGRSRSFVGMPAYYDHAQSGIKSQIGQVVDTEEDEEGIDFLVELDRARRYIGDVLGLYRQKALGGSTGAPGHLVVRQGGTLKRWIISEISATPTPAEPRTHAALKTIQEYIMPDEPTIASATQDTDALKTEVKALKIESASLRTELNELKALPAVAKQRDPHTAVADLGGAIGGGLNARADEGRYHNMKALFLPGGRARMAERYPEGVFGGYVKAVLDAKTSLDRSSDARKALREVYGVSEDDTAAKALGTQAGVSGAVLIPDQFIAQLMQVAQQKDALYGRAMVIPADGGEIVIPALDHGGTYTEGQSQYYGGVSLAWGDDDAAPAHTEPRFRQLKLKTNSLKARVRVKNSLLQRSAITIDSVVTSLLGGGVGWARDYAMVRGTGVGQPQGALNAAACIDAGGTAIDYATLVGMESRTIPERDENYIWLIHTLRRGDVMALQQTNNTLVTFLPDLRGKPGTLLMGRQVVYTDKLPYTSGASNAADSVLLIDPTMIVCAEFQGIALAVSDQVRFEDDETVFRVILSMDSQPWLTSTIAIGAGANDTISGYIKL